MGQFEVYNSFPGEFTFISNHFLDRYMPSANGEFVKIYLYLLRHACQEKTLLELSSIADVFNCTEADVLRALRYWKKTGILDVSFDSKGVLTRVVFYPITAKAETPFQNSLEEAAAGLESPKETISSSLTPDKIRALKGNDEVRQLLFIAEQYLGKTLTPTDMETLLFLYDEVGLSAELMEYLIEYCVSKGSTSMAYIKKVGLAWAEQKNCHSEPGKRRNKPLQSKLFYDIKSLWYQEQESSGKGNPVYESLDEPVWIHPGYYF